MMVDNLFFIYNLFKNKFKYLKLSHFFKIYNTPIELENNIELIQYRMISILR